MKNICFESYRRSKRDKLLAAKPKPKQLDPTWYTDNIYSNRSEDLEEDYVPDCIKYGTYRKLRNIREQDEFYGDDGSESRGRRIDGEGSAGYNLQRSTSCKEFQYPKSQSYCFGENPYESRTAKIPSGSSRGLPTASILKKTSNVPKSYSFSATSKTTPFDVMDYDLPPVGNTRREKQEAFRKSMGYYYSNSLDESTLAHAHDIHTCCAREHCTNAKCLLNEIYTSYPGPRRTWRRGTPLGGIYGADASGGSNGNLHVAPDWLEDDRLHRMATSRYPVICCCAAEDCCCRRRQQRHISRSTSRLHCPHPLHHPAAEEEEHCRSLYNTELEHFIRDERERLMLQDKFLDDDEHYLAAVSRSPSQYRYSTLPTAATDYHRHSRDIQPPSRYDEDTCSDSTEMDLEDFNIDLEKYWEELEKPPSPIDLDMQRRNMHSNLKVKNVNVGCYNNGQPIDLHDREQERMMIKKSLLEGMPSPPQTGPSNNESTLHFFEQGSSPLNRAYNYGHKVYPVQNMLPTYKYNNFYPEQTVQTRQPTSTGHHTSAGGHSALSLINNIFSIYKPNKYSPLNCQMNIESKPEPCKKMNVPSTRRPLGALHSEYMHSMKRPLIVSTEQPHFKIIPEKTGLKISPLYNFDDYGEKQQMRHKLTSTARPLMLPH